MKYFNNDIFTNPGDPIHVLYSPVVQDDGSIELVECGKENTDDIIQSYVESTDIRMILARAEAGDFSGLNARQGTFGDFTNVPNTYAELLQLQMDSNNLFMSLPKDVRAKFDNDPMKFFAQAGTKDWALNLGDVLPDNCKELYIGKEEEKKSVEE